MYYLQYLFLLLLGLLMPPSISESDNKMFLNCTSPAELPCVGDSFDIRYPFWSPNRSEYCGHPGFNLTCTGDDGENSRLMITLGGKEYQVNYIDYTNQLVKVTDPNFIVSSCPQSFTNTTLNLTLVNYTATLDLNLTLYLNCSPGFPFDPTLYNNITCHASDSGYYSYYRIPNNEPSPPLDPWGICSSIVLVPMYQIHANILVSNPNGFLDALQDGFGLTWTVGIGRCGECEKSGGVCGYNSSTPDAPTCFCPKATSASGTCVDDKSSAWKIAIGVSVGAIGFIAACCLAFFCYKRRKRLQQSGLSNLLSWSTSSKLSSKKDPELGEANYQTHIFAYDELHEATNGFDASRELGDGGFGTVYKGKLRDGRTVAVKRLYENNYRRLEQFMNEVDILSRLRHQNLVALYGCTSRHSRELLLVYEFVPNGTVADHLHGSLASEGALPWPVRMSIAIETADALAYLHAVEPQIIHRDVKTNNILLDNSFHVKVADFGLSRLFPLDATHVSTAPQGTPGYVDPEYHQCYQLTDKSDVYSFGVVLVELISSKPAVDISRHRHEINLANMAISKIQNCQLDQLVDPGLGYQTDLEMKMMITQVAEVAFRCLQSEREMRPSIKEVLEVLRGIESGGSKVENGGQAADDVPIREEGRLLKNVLPYSPDSVTGRWTSRSTTSSSSC